MTLIENLCIMAANSAPLLIDVLLDNDQGEPAACYK